MILQQAKKLSSVLGVNFDKTHENTYQRVFKHSDGQIDLDAAQRAGHIQIVKEGTVFREFDMDNIRYVAVPTLKTITQAKAA